MPDNNDLPEMLDIPPHLQLSLSNLSMRDMSENKDNNTTGNVKNSNTGHNTNSINSGFDSTTGFTAGQPSINHTLHIPTQHSNITIKNQKLLNTLYLPGNEPNERLDNNNMYNNTRTVPSINHTDIGRNMNNIDIISRKNVRKGFFSHGDDNDDDDDDDDDDSDEYGTLQIKNIHKTNSNTNNINHNSSTKSVDINTKNKTSKQNNQNNHDHGEGVHGDNEKEDRDEDDEEFDDYDPLYFDSKLGSQSSLDSLNLILEKQRKQQLNNPFHQEHIFYPVKETNRISLEYDPVNKKTVLNQYEIIKELGHGEHGKVKLAKDLHTSKLVAIKILDRVEPIRNKLKHFNAEMPTDGLLENVSVKREINIMKKLNHEHIVKLLEVLDDIESRKIYLVLEYCSRGEIRWCLGDQIETRAKGPPVLSFLQARKIFRDVVLGVEYLHSRGVIHRDIKPANLLLSDDNVVKISDFGVSLSVSTANEDELCRTAGTPAFYAPEICLGVDAAIEKFGGTRKTIISYPIDIWALGITLFCLLFGRLPFICLHEMELFDKIINEKLDFPKNMASYDVESNEFHQAQNLLLKLLEKNPYKRITVRDIKLHPFTLHNMTSTEKEFFLQSQYQLNDELLFMGNDEFHTYNENSKRGIDDMRLIDKSLTRDFFDSDINTFNHHHHHQHHSNHHSHHPRNSKLVSLPVNSSFASLDSFYIDSFAQAKVNKANISHFGSDSNNISRRFSNSSEVPSSTLSRLRKNSNDFIGSHKINSGKISNADKKSRFSAIDIPQNHLIPLQKIRIQQLKNSKNHAAGNINNHNVVKAGILNEDNNGFVQSHNFKGNHQSMKYTEPLNSIPSNHTHYLNPASSYSSSTNDLIRTTSASSDSSSEYGYGYYASTNNRYATGSDTESLPFEFRVDSAQNSMISLDKLNNGNNTLRHTLKSNNNNISTPDSNPLDIQNHHSQPMVIKNTGNNYANKQHGMYRFSSSESSSYSSTTDSESIDSYQNHSPSRGLNININRESSNSAFNNPHSNNLPVQQISADSYINSQSNASMDELMINPGPSIREIRSEQGKEYNVIVDSNQDPTHKVPVLKNPELDKSSSTICAVLPPSMQMQKNPSISTLQEVEQLDIPNDILLKLSQPSVTSLNTMQLSTDNTSTIQTVPSLRSMQRTIPIGGEISTSTSSLLQPGMNMASTVTTASSSSTVGQTNRNIIPTTVTNDIGVLSVRTKNDIKSVDLLHSVLKRKDENSP